jgi:hypothetical protein
MPRKVSPPVSEHHRLRTLLDSGEKKVFEFFDTHLNEDWEIYIQPHMNGLRPDFVLLNPNVGLAVFEVKDWTLKEKGLPYRMEKKRGGQYTLKLGANANVEGRNPINKINLYREEVFSLYCPRLGENANGFAAVSAGVIFSDSLGKHAKELFSPIMGNLHPQYFTITGCDSLNAGEVGVVFPVGRWQKSKIMTPDLANDFRGWLEEPEYYREQRQSLKLNSRQEELVANRTASGFRRVKGPAGSGKSIVIAARAAQLAQEGKSVLVVCYNVTLVNYLRDLCARWTAPLKRREVVNKVTWMHFHQWCKRTCYELGEKEAYKQFWSDRLGDGNSEDEDEIEVADKVFDQELGELVAGIIDKHPDDLKKYDAILVDEGQDFMPEWWNVLRKVNNSEGEMMLVADASQDIYEKAEKWTDDAMTGAGFPGGQWYELSGSYRLPTKFLPYLREFADHFLDKEMVDIPEETQETFLKDIEGDCSLRWVHAEQQSQKWVCYEEILRLISRDDGEVIPVPDVTVLVSTSADGLWLAGKLKEINIRTINTFAESKKDRKMKKVVFYKGDARVKLTTVHSFKGIESRAMVISLGKGGASDNALAYTAMTRLKRCEGTDRGSYLTVVSSHPEFKLFGKTWPDYEEVIPDATDVT